MTYEVMNRDSAIVLAREAARAGAGAFAYISAAGGAPVLPARYISTKREAEATIAREFSSPSTAAAGGPPQLRSVFVRPPFLYDGSRPLTLPLAAAAGAGAVFNRLTGGVLGGFMGAAGAKPLRVDLVAEAVVEALSDGSVSGPVEVPQIEELAEKGWRNGML